MEIVDVRKKEEVEFSDLSVGSILEVDNEFYIKVGTYDAFNLNQNRMDEFDQVTAVKNREAKLTVY